MNKDNITAFRDSLGDITDKAVDLAYISKLDEQCEIAERFIPVVKTLVSHYVDKMTMEEMKKVIEYLSYDYLYAWLPSNNDIESTTFE